MAIDLEKFSEEKTKIMPFVNGWGKCMGRKVKLVVEDGWYQVRFGDTVLVGRRATPLEIMEALRKAKQYRGLALGEEVVPWNFENLFRKGHGETARVHFLDFPIWEVVKFAEWEDGRFYSAGADLAAKRGLIDQAKEAFEKGGSLSGIKGVTPEVRYYFLLLALQKHSYERFKELEKLRLSEEEREKRISEFGETFAGRLEDTIKKAGGKLVRFSKRGKSRYTVVWKVGRQQITSVIKDNMGIYDLGFCASGHDKEHTIASAIQLAKMYREDGDIYITRE